MPSKGDEVVGMAGMPRLTPGCAAAAPCAASICSRIVTLLGTGDARTCKCQVQQLLSCAVQQRPHQQSSHNKEPV